MASVQAEWEEPEPWTPRDGGCKWSATEDHLGEDHLRVPMVRKPPQDKGHTEA